MSHFILGSRMMTMAQHGHVVPTRPVGEDDGECTGSPALIESDVAKLLNIRLNGDVVAMLVLGNAPALRDQSGVQVLVVSLELNPLPPVQGVLILEVAKQRKVVTLEGGAINALPIVLVRFTVVAVLAQVLEEMFLAAERRNQAAVSWT